MRQRLATSAIAVLAFVLIFVPAATTAVGVDSTAYRNAVSATGMQTHLQQFQSFGDASVPAFGHRTRVDGSVGFTKSVEYVQQQMIAAGYQVRVQPFTFDRFEETAPPVFRRLSPTAQTYVNGTDFQTMDYSGSGNIPDAPLAAAGGIVIPSPGGSTSGCTAGDFAGFPAGAVALIQRGTCTFREKATNAKAAGAVGVVIFNEGNVDPSDDRIGVIFGTLDPPQFDIPVIGTSFAVGQDLLNMVRGSATVRVNLAVTAHVVSTQSANVIADTPGGRADRTVVVGAHLDR